MDIITQRAVEEIAKPSEREAVEHMVAFVDAHVSERMTLADVSRAGAVGRSECSRLFSEYLGTSPMDYVAHVRVARACTLLRDESLPLSEVARSCGYSSPSYFSQAFRRLRGVTPSEYRRRVTAREELAPPWSARGLR